MEVSPVFIKTFITEPKMDHEGQTLFRSWPPNTKLSLQSTQHACRSNSRKMERQCILWSSNAQ